MKFGFTVNIDKKKKEQEVIKQIVKEQIEEHSKTTEIKETNQVIQTGNSKTEDISISIKETEINEITETSNTSSKDIYQNIIEDQLELDASGNSKPKSKKITFINDNSGNTINQKMILLFQNCGYDCGVKFKCVFSIACFKKTINDTKNSIVNAVSCVASSVSNAICKTTKCITSNVSSAASCIGNAICSGTKKTASVISTGYKNMISNISYAYTSTTSFFKRSYTSTKTTIKNSYLVRHVKNINQWRITIYTKKAVKTFFIYVFCLFICIRNKKVDKNSEEYKEEYIRNNATYSTEFDHLPILGDDAII